MPEPLLALNDWQRRDKNMFLNKNGVKYYIHRNNGSRIQVLFDGLTFNPQNAENIEF